MLDHPEVTFDGVFADCGGHARGFESHRRLEADARGGRVGRPATIVVDQPRQDGPQRLDVAIQIGDVPRYVCGLGHVSPRGAGANTPEIEIASASAPHRVAGVGRRELATSAVHVLLRSAH